MVALVALTAGVCEAQTLLHHWKFDELTGQTADDSAGDADGTLGSTSGVEASDPTIDQPGVFGRAYRFDETENDRVTIADRSAVGSLTTGSITGWLNTGSVGAGFRGVLFRYGDSTANDRIIFEMREDGKLYLVLRNNNSNSVELFTAAAYDDGNWHHFAITQDGSAARLYIDGSELTGAALASNNTSGDWFTVISDTANAMSIGWENRSSAANLPFGGRIDDVAIFGGALDSDEVANVMTQGAQNFDNDTSAPSLVAKEPDSVTGIYPGTALTALFSEPIALSGSGTITIVDTGDGSGIQTINLPAPSQVTVSGAELLIKPSTPLEFGTNFEVLISPDSIEDTATPANPFPGTTSGQWIFSTAAQDTSAPVIALKTPDDNATDVSRGTDLVATFDENIVPGSGDIVIRDLFDGSTTQTVAVTDTSQVSIAANVLTIDLAGSLAADRDYAVQIAAGAVKNYSDVPFAGIAVSDVTTWNFRTRDEDPNIIFILGDDQAWYDYGFMRRPGVEKAAIDMNASIYQVVQTPSLDRLADQGMTFTHGYAVPICRPSLASMITGAFPHQTLITGNDPVSGPDTAFEARMQVLNPLPRTLATELGYTSFQTGKWWEGHFDNGGFTAGDTVNSTAGGTAPVQWGGGTPGYVRARHGDWGLMTGRVDYANNIAAPAAPIPYADTVQTATDFIDAQVANAQPFFLWYAPFLPHTPHDPPSGLISKYDALIDEPSETGNFFAKYYANIERFDGGVGAILDHLDSAGITDNTIVVLICDNGWINRPNSSAYDARSKQTPYEGGIRTPIIVRWPDRIKQGGAIEPQVITKPVSLVDLVPTVHDALGLATFPEMTGVSLLDLAAVNARDTVFSEDSRHDMQSLNDPSQSLEARVAIRDGWKLILFTNGSSELYHLYNTSTGAPVDPHETNDLSASNPALVSELTTAIVNWYCVAPNDFDSWISDPAFGIDPAEQDLDLDPDGDTLSNGIEAWFGTHPGEASKGILPIAVDTESGTFTITHPVNQNPAIDLTATYRWSTDLQEFANDAQPDAAGTTTVTFDPGIPSGGFVTVTATVTGSVIPQRLFVVMQVTQD